MASNRSKYPAMGSTDNVDVVLDATGEKNPFERNSNIRRSDQQKLIDAKLPQVYGEVVQTPSTPGGDEGRLLIRDNKKVTDLEEYNPPPKDDFNLVYIIMLINGIGVLMPWNVFINARNYFINYKFKEVPNEDYVVNFLTYVGVAAQVPNLVLCFINTFVQPRGNLTFRILGSLVVLIITLTITVSFAMVDSFDWPKLFFIITMITVIFSNGAVGIYQNCIYGMAADLPISFTACVVLGSNVCGTFISVLNILAELAGQGDARMSAIYYFLTALFVILVCFDSYFVLPYSKFYLHYKRQAHEHRMTEHQSQMDKHKDRHFLHAHFAPYWVVFKKAWIQMFNIFFVFFVSLACFPAILADIEPIDNNFFLAGGYFRSVGCFLVFNFFAMIGNLIPHWIRFPGPRFVWIPVLLRGLFLPFFFFCNFRPLSRTWPVYIQSDWAYLGMAILMSFTSGYFSSLVMMYAPRVVSPDKSRMSAMLATFFLVLGIVSGINFNFVIYLVTDIGPLGPGGISTTLAANLTSTLSSALT